MLLNHLKSNNLFRQLIILLVVIEGYEHAHNPSPAVAIAAACIRNWGP